MINKFAMALYAVNAIVSLVNFLYSHETGWLSALIAWFLLFAFRTLNLLEEQRVK